VFAAETTALDIATAVVAGYAAIIGTLALGFEMFQWATTWQTRVDVNLKRMSLYSQASPDEPVILFTLTNHSAHDVKVTHVSLEPLRRKGPHLFIPHPLPRPVAGPFPIAARDSVTVYIKPDAVSEAEHDPNWKTRGKVTTSDGRTFRSKKVRVGELLSDA
jgi:hypothetical protein